MKKILIPLLALVLVGAACAKQPRAVQLPPAGGFDVNRTLAEDQFSPAYDWQKVGQTWSALIKPPDCPAVVLKTPVDLSVATAVLYPGQNRGGHYKSDGGFIFGGLTTNTVRVVIPMDGYVVNASRYQEQGETHYLFTFMNPCGIMYRFDHLLTLSKKFQTLANTLPPAQLNVTTPTLLTTNTTVKAGETLATAVGYSKPLNVTVDFGVYDLRHRNTAAQNVDWAASHDPELAPYGVCWFDLLSTSDAATVRHLPGGDPQSGTTSDYCQP